MQVPGQKRCLQTREKPQRTSGEAPALRDTRADARLLPSRTAFSCLPTSLSPWRNPGAAGHRPGCILGGWAQGSREGGERGPACPDRGVLLCSASLWCHQGGSGTHRGGNGGLMAPLLQPPGDWEPRDGSGLGETACGTLLPEIPVCHWMSTQQFSQLSKSRQHQLKALFSGSHFLYDSKNRSFQATLGDSTKRSHRRL